MSLPGTLYNELSVNVTVFRFALQIFRSQADQKTAVSNGVTQNLF